MDERLHPETGCIMGAPREVATSGQTRRDGRVTTRMRTILLLGPIPFSHIQTHFKSPTCYVFVHVTSE
jgi:hypothetical protein